MKNIILESLSKKSKIEDMVDAKGLENVSREFQEIINQSKEIKTKEGSYRYMDFKQFLKVTSENQKKPDFVMPLFWGWCYPFVKYCSVILLI